MKTRFLGRTGERVSEIGFGAWGIGKSWWGKTDDAESLKTLRAALEAGITLYDTAYVYGDGHSEDLIRQVLKETGQKPFVSTKCPPKNGEWPGDPRKNAEDAFPESWVIQCTERSLKKLGTDCLDLQQLHVWTDAWTDADGWRNAVEKLKRQGKIKHFGVSLNDYAPNDALKIVSSGAVDAVQVIYNIFEQTPAETLFPLCQEKNVGVIVRVPLDEGSLAGALTPQTRFEEGDFREDYFRGERLPETCKRVDVLKGFCGPHAPTLALLALKFVLSHPAVSVVIPGMRKVSRVHENIAASQGDPLPEDVQKALRAHAWPRNFYE